MFETNPKLYVPNRKWDIGNRLFTTQQSTNGSQLLTQKRTDYTPKSIVLLTQLENYLALGFSVTAAVAQKRFALQMLYYPDFHQTSPLPARF